MQTSYNDITSALHHFPAASVRPSLSNIALPVLIIISGVYAITFTDSKLLRQIG